jgi:PAS domain S-box-containing protein
MVAVEWFRQGFDLLLSLQKARPNLTSDTLLEKCLRDLLLFTKADEVSWIEQGSLSSLCINSSSPAITPELKFSYEEQYSLLEHKEAGPVSLSLSSQLTEQPFLRFLLPISGNKTAGCYVLSYHSLLDTSDEFSDFLQVCQQAITDLHHFFDLRNRYEKLKVRFSGILKSLPHGIVFLEDEGDYCWVNKNAAQLLDVPSGTIKPIQIHAAMAFSRKKASIVQEIEEKAGECLKQKQWKWIFHEPEFKVFDVRLKKVSTSMISGDLWIWEDITRSYTYDQKLIQLNNELTLKKEQAEEINQRYRYVGEATSDAIWDWDLESNLLFWGKNYEAIFGYDADLRISTIDSWKANIHPQDLVRVVNGLARVIEGTERHWAQEYRYQRADGSFVYVTDKAFVIRNEQGKALRVVGAMQDITKNKAAEIKIRDAEFNLRAIFESSIESFLLLDSFNCVKAFNGRARDFIQMAWSKDLEIGQNILSYLDYKSAEKFNDYLNQVASGQVIEYDWKSEGENASVYWSHFTLAPVYHQGVVIGTSVTERDITEMKKHLETIENQNRTFMDISWTQSHLVRAPVANIIGIAALLRSNSSCPENDELIDYLEASAVKLDEVVRKITDLTFSGGAK